MARSEPYGANRPGPLLVLALGTGGLAALAVALAGSRDLGAGRLPVSAGRRPRTVLLRSPVRFAVLRTLRGLTGWAIGLAAYFLLIGLLTTSLVRFMADNPRFADLAAQAGFTELGTPEGYVAALFSLLAVPVGVFAAGRISADAADEADRRLTMLFALPLTRTRWAGIQTGVTGFACTTLAIVAGLATFAGTNLAGADLGLLPVLAGVLNAVPVALLCLGAALLALGWAPRAVVPLGTLPMTGGFLVQVLADSFGWPDWIRTLSPFAHLAGVPAVPPDWADTAGILAVAAVLAVAGTVRYARRDLRG